MIRKQLARIARADFESYQFREALYEMHKLCNAIQSQETCMSPSVEVLCIGHTYTLIISVVIKNYCDQGQGQYGFAPTPLYWC